MSTASKLAVGAALAMGFAPVGARAQAFSAESAKARQQAQVSLARYRRALESGSDAELADAASDAASDASYLAGLLRHLDAHR